MVKGHQGNMLCNAIIYLDPSSGQFSLDAFQGSLNGKMREKWSVMLELCVCVHVCMCVHKVFVYIIHTGVVCVMHVEHKQLVFPIL